MSTNYKNLLQEYYQKRCLSLPIYNLIDDKLLPNNSHIFTTEVILPSPNPTNPNPNPTNPNPNPTNPPTKYIGKGPTKKESQQNAAQKAYRNLSTTLPSSPSSYIPPDPKEVQQVILIDIENMPQALPPQQQYPSHSHIIGFISIYSSHYKKREQIRTHCDLRIIDSAVKDSADVALIFECGRIVATSSDIRIIIMTSDHYAEPLLKLVNEALPTKPHLKITCISNLSKF